MLRTFVRKLTAADSRKVPARQFSERAAVGRLELLESRDLLSISPAIQPTLAMGPALITPVEAAQIHTAVANGNVSTHGAATVTGTGRTAANVDRGNSPDNLNSNSPLNAASGLAAESTFQLTTNALAKLAGPPFITPATTVENHQTTSGLVITPAAADSGRVTGFQITGISGGKLFQHNGTTAIANNAFITLAQGAAGLKFTPKSGSLANGSFTVQETSNGKSTGLGGAKASATIIVTPPVAIPGVPQNVVGTAGPGQVSLSWTPVTGATSYNVYAATSSGGEGNTPIATGLTSASYTNSGLTGGVTYYYQVTAVNSAGQGSRSTETSAVPTLAVPQNMSCTPGSADILVTWSPVAGATSYNLYLSTSPGGEGNTPMATGWTSTSVDWVNLAAGTTYYFQVTAVDSVGEGPRSSEVSATTVLGAPQGLQATPGPAIGDITLEWAKVNGATRYNIYRSISPSGEGSIPVAVVLNSPSFTDTNLLPGYTYYYQVTAVDDVGEGPRSNEVSAMAFFSKPSAPGFVQCTPGNNGQITVSWASVPSATSYNVYAATASGSEGSTPIATGLTGFPEYTYMGATAGTNYYFQVTAVNILGESDKSFEVAGQSIWDSNNWSGYVASTNINNPQANSVDEVAGSWNVPTVSVPPNQASNGDYHSSVWVGIDGAGPGGDTVEQIGTSQDVVNGTPTYFAWYEMYSTIGQAPPYTLNITIHPGDQIYADAINGAAQGQPGWYFFYLKDETTGAVVTPIQRSYFQNPQPQNSCAEWIVEAPGVTASTLPAFTPVNFSNAWVEINGVGYDANGPNAQFTPWEMTGNNADQTSALGTSQSGAFFNVTYGSNTANVATTAMAALDAAIGGSGVAMSPGAIGSTATTLQGLQPTAISTNGVLSGNMSPTRSAPEDLFQPQVAIAQVRGGARRLRGLADDVDRLRSWQNSVDLALTDQKLLEDCEGMQWALM